VYGEADPVGVPTTQPAPLGETVKSDAVRLELRSTSVEVSWKFRVGPLFGVDGGTSATVGGPVSIVVELDVEPEPDKPFDPVTPALLTVTVTIPSPADALLTVKV
jgi:hypothetical protein